MNIYSGISKRYYLKLNKIKDKSVILILQLKINYSQSMEGNCKNLTFNNDSLIPNSCSDEYFVVNPTCQSQTGGLIDIMPAVPALITCILQFIV